MSPQDVFELVAVTSVIGPCVVATEAAAGVDNPEMRHDNNTVAVAVLGGWIYPALAVALALGIQALLVRHRVEQG